MKPYNPIKYGEGELLTVEKLREKLNDLPPNMPVCVRNKYVSDIHRSENYVLHEGNAFKGDDEVFHIYF